MANNFDKRAEEALYKAQTELAHVTRVATLGEMTASIAHEINQRSGGQQRQCLLRWLAAEPGGPESARYHRDGHRASAGRASPRKLRRERRLDINETILEVIALARSEAQRSRVSLQTQLAKEVPLILGDRIQLQQVILNLIINAIEAMSGVGEGPRELQVGSGKDNSQGVLVTVRDSGPGLSCRLCGRLKGLSVVGMGQRCGSV